MPSTSTPVAIGSSVPACPTLRVPMIRRARATTSCDVMPAGLSTIRRPGGGAGRRGGLGLDTRQTLAAAGRGTDDASGGHDGVRAAWPAELETVAELRWRRVAEQDGLPGRLDRERPAAGAGRAVIPAD